MNTVDIGQSLASLNRPAWTQYDLLAFNHRHCPARPPKRDDRGVVIPIQLNYYARSWGRR